MTSEYLKQVLELHVAWRGNKPGGQRADLSGADLSSAYLSGANLSGANLSDANLSDADLRRANLSGGMYIMQIMASLTYLVALSTSDGLEVRSGCKHYPIAWWQENGEQLACDHGYTDVQIAEYKRHFAYIAEWHAAVRQEAPK